MPGVSVLKKLSSKQSVTYQSEIVPDHVDITRREPVIQVLTWIASKKKLLSRGQRLINQNTNVKKKNTQNMLLRY